MPARSKKNHRTQKNQNGSFRIIAGEWRSRRLEFTAVEGLRPTTDRVKETVFNWLMPYLPGANILDTFAGSGSLGFEALSRGANHTTFYELNTLACNAIRNNIKTLNADANLEQGNALELLESGALENFDLIFLDPPFRTPLLESALRILDQPNKLKQGCLVYVELELEKQGLAIPSRWKLKKEKQAGQVSYRLYEVAGTSE